MSKLDDHFTEADQIFETAKGSKARTFGSVLGSLIANICIGASYAFGALLVWDVFFR